MGACRVSRGRATPHGLTRPYGFRAYYADDVKPPKRPGDLAIEVRWADAAGRDMEADLAEARPDIGRVERFGP